MSRNFLAKKDNYYAGSPSDTLFTYTNLHDDPDFVDTEWVNYAAEFPQLNIEVEAAGKEKIRSKALIPMVNSGSTLSVRAAARAQMIQDYDYMEIYEIVYPDAVKNYRSSHDMAYAIGKSLQLTYLQRNYCFYENGVKQLLDREDAQLTTGVCFTFTNTTLLETYRSFELREGIRIQYNGATVIADIHPVDRYKVNLLLLSAKSYDTGVKHLLRVYWIDDNDSTFRFANLYVTPVTYLTVPTSGGTRGPDDVLMWDGALIRGESRFDILTPFGTGTVSAGSIVNKKVRGTLDPYNSAYMSGGKGFILSYTGLSNTTFGSTPYKGFSPSKMLLKSHQNDTHFHFKSEVSFNGATFEEHTSISYPNGTNYYAKPQSSWITLDKQHVTLDGVVAENAHFSTGVRTRYNKLGTKTSDYTDFASNTLLEPLFYTRGGSLKYTLVPIRSVERPIVKLLNGNSNNDNLFLDLIEQQFPLPPSILSLSVRDIDDNNESVLLNKNHSSFEPLALEDITDAIVRIEEGGSFQIRCILEDGDNSEVDVLINTVDDSNYSTPPNPHQHVNSGGIAFAIGPTNAIARALYETGLPTTVMRTMKVPCGWKLKPDDISLYTCSTTYDGAEISDRVARILNTESLDSSTPGTVTVDVLLRWTATTYANVLGVQLKATEVVQFSKQQCTIEFVDVLHLSDSTPLIIEGGYHFTNDTSVSLEPLLRRPLAPYSEESHNYWVKADLVPRLVINSVDIDIEDEYIIRYGIALKDKKERTVERRVIVKDPTPKTKRHVTIQKGDDYIEEGATDIQGNILSPTSQSDTVNTDVPGVYSVHFQVDDSKGLIRTATKSVYVVYLDTEGSKIAYLDPTTVGSVDSAPNGYLRALLENEVDEITVDIDGPQVSFLRENVGSDTWSVQVAQYRVVNGNGSTGDWTSEWSNFGKIAQTVDVIYGASVDASLPFQSNLTVKRLHVKDATPILNGVANLEIEKGTTYVDAGALDCHGETLDPVVTNTVDVNTPGVYTVEYSASLNGSPFKTTKRTVNVVHTLYNGGVWGVVSGAILLQHLESGLLVMGGNVGDLFEIKGQSNFKAIVSEDEITIERQYFLRTTQDIILRKPMVANSTTSFVEPYTHGLPSAEYHAHITQFLAYINEGSADVNVARTKHIIGDQASVLRTAPVKILAASPNYGSTTDRDEVFNQTMATDGFRQYRNTIYMGNQPEEDRDLSLQDWFASWRNQDNRGSGRILPTSAFIGGAAAAEAGAVELKVHGNITCTGYVSQYSGQEHIGWDYIVNQAQNIDFLTDGDSADKLEKIAAFFTLTDEQKEFFGDMSDGNTARDYLGFMKASGIQTMGLERSYKYSAISMEEIQKGLTNLQASILQVRDAFDWLSIHTRCKDIAPKTSEKIAFYMRIHQHLYFNDYLSVIEEYVKRIDIKSPSTGETGLGLFIQSIRDLCRSRRVWFLDKLQGGTGMVYTLPTDIGSNNEVSALLAVSRIHAIFTQKKVKDWTTDNGFVFTPTAPLSIPIQYGLYYLPSSVQHKTVKVQNRDTTEAAKYERHGYITYAEFDQLSSTDTDVLEGLYAVPQEAAYAGIWVSYRPNIRKTNVDTDAGGYVSEMEPNEGKGVYMKRLETTEEENTTPRYCFTETTLVRTRPTSSNSAWDVGVLEYVEVESTVVSRVHYINTEGLAQVVDVLAGGVLIEFQEPSANLFVHGSSRTQTWQRGSKTVMVYKFEGYQDLADFVHNSGVTLPAITDGLKYNRGFQPSRYNTSPALQTNGWYRLWYSPSENPAPPYNHLLASSSLEVDHYILGDKLATLTAKHLPHIYAVPVDEDNSVGLGSAVKWEAEAVDMDSVYQFENMDHLIRFCTDFSSVRSFVNNDMWDMNRRSVDESRFWDLQTQSLIKLAHSVGVEDEMVTVLSRATPTLLSATNVIEDAMYLTVVGPIVAFESAYASLRNVVLGLPAGTTLDIETVIKNAIFGKSEVLDALVQRAMWDALEEQIDHFPELMSAKNSIVLLLKLLNVDPHSDEYPAKFKLGQNVDAFAARLEDSGIGQDTIDGLIDKVKEFPLLLISKNLLMFRSITTGCIQVLNDLLGDYIRDALVTMLVEIGCAIVNLIPGSNIDSGKASENVRDSLRNTGSAMSSLFEFMFGPLHAYVHVTETLVDYDANPSAFLNTLFPKEEEEEETSWWEDVGDAFEDVGDAIVHVVEDTIDYVENGDWLELGLALVMVAVSTVTFGIPGALYFSGRVVGTLLEDPENWELKAASNWDAAMQYAKRFATNSEIKAAEESVLGAIELVKDETVDDEPLRIKLDPKSLQVGDFHSIPREYPVTFRVPVNPGTYVGNVVAQYPVHSYEDQGSSGGGGGLMHAIRKISARVNGTDTINTIQSSNYGTIMNRYGFDPTALTYDTERNADLDDTVITSLKSTAHNSFEKTIIDTTESVQTAAGTHVYEHNIDNVELTVYLDDGTHHRANDFQVRLFENSVVGDRDWRKLELNVDDTNTISISWLLPNLIQTSENSIFKADVFLPEGMKVVWDIVSSNGDHAKFGGRPRARVLDSEKDEYVYGYLSDILLMRDVDGNMRAFVFIENEAGEFLSNTREHVSKPTNPTAWGGPSQEYYDLGEAYRHDIRTVDIQYRFNTLHQKYVVPLEQPMLELDTGLTGRFKNNLGSMGGVISIQDGGEKAMVIDNIETIVRDGKTYKIGTFSYSDGPILLKQENGTTIGTFLRVEFEYSSRGIISYQRIYYTLLDDQSNEVYFKWDYEEDDVSSRNVSQMMRTMGSLGLNDTTGQSVLQYEKVIFHFTGNLVSVPITQKLKSTIRFNNKTIDTGEPVEFELVVSSGAVYVPYFNSILNFVPTDKHTLESRPYENIAYQNRLQPFADTTPFPIDSEGTYYAVSEDDPLLSIFRGNMNIYVYGEDRSTNAVGKQKHSGCTVVNTVVFIPNEAFDEYGRVVHAPILLTRHGDHWVTTELSMGDAIMIPVVKLSMPNGSRPLTWYKYDAESGGTLGGCKTRKGKIIKLENNSGVPVRYRHKNKWSIGYVHQAEPDWTMLLAETMKVFDDWFGNGFKGFITKLGDTCMDFVSDIFDPDFTGSHSCLTDQPELFGKEYIGRVVVATGRIATRTSILNSKVERIKKGSAGVHVNDSWPVVELSSSYKQKSVFGVISGEKIFHKTADAYPVGPHRQRWLGVNQVGEGAVLVDDTHGDIENGDYLVTSHIPGFATKQEDDLMRSCTLAKTTMDMRFDEYDKVRTMTREDGTIVRFALVACTYHC